jgi:hemolysin D
LKQLDSQIGEIRYDYRNKLLKELSENRQRTIALSAKFRQSAFVNARQKIVAPVDGIINERFVNTVSGVVTPAEKLMTLVPKNQPLQVEAVAENKDAGFIRGQMPVAIKIDAFDYQRYGVIPGVVTRVSSDSIHDEKLGDIFKVLIAPQKRSLMVDGRPVPISCGMTVVAEVKVGKRRIIEFFLNPILKSWDKSVSLK